MHIFPNISFFHNYFHLKQLQMKHKQQPQWPSFINKLTMNKTHIVYSFPNTNQTSTLPHTRIHLAYLHMYIKNWIQPSTHHFQMSQFRSFLVVSFQKQNPSSTTTQRLKGTMHTLSLHRSDVHWRLGVCQMSKKIRASDHPAKRQFSPKMQKSLKGQTYISWPVCEMSVPSAQQTAPPNSSWVQTCKRV